MPYTIDIIKQKWLVVGTIPYSEEQVLTAFNEVEYTLGQEWLTNIKFQNGIESSGVILTIDIVELGIKLGVLKNGVNYKTLISKLLSPISKEKAIAELNAIALICSNEDNIKFELEPEVLKSNSKVSYPDFRVKKNTDNVWTYIEVKQPDLSDENKAARRTLDTIQKLFNQNINFLTLEIILKHVPSKEEINLLYNECRGIFQTQVVEEKTIEDLGIIKINYGQPIEYVVSTHEGFEDRPMLYYIGNVIRDGIPVKRITIGIAVSDERAWRFLKDASTQLCSTCPGIIFLDGGNVPKSSFKNWSTLLGKQIKDKPDLNKIVSSVVTHSSNIENKTNEGTVVTTVNNDVSIIINENANYQVPSWIIDKLQQ